VAAPSPQAISAAFADAINSGNLTAALDLWSPDAVIIRPDGVLVRGIDEIAKALRALVDSGARLEITLLGVVAAGDVALASGVFTVGASTDEEPSEHRSSSIVVYRRELDGWRVAIDAPWGLAGVSLAAAAS
jgi:ketosteroid isomerase-like protein